jgi:hypothetical protein
MVADYHYDDAAGNPTVGCSDAPLLESWLPQSSITRTFFIHTASVKDPDSPDAVVEMQLGGRISSFEL